VTIAFHALWMLCALGTVVYSAAAARRARDLTALAIGFVVATIVTSPQRLPDPAWVGVLSAGIAMVALFRPRFAVLAAAWGGALGGMLTALTEVQGLHPAASVGPVVVLVVTVVWLTRLRPTFAPDVLRDEALMAVCLLGLLVAIVPGVIDGWQAAANLTIEPATPGPATPIPAWTLTLVGTATALGAVYSLWSRR
jgi:hypothetical protein